MGRQYEKKNNFYFIDYNRNFRWVYRELCLFVERNKEKNSVKGIIGQASGSSSAFG